MPSLPKFNIKLPKLSGQLILGRGSGSDVVGLDIQPGFAGVVKASVNGSILAERAAWLPLGPDVIREGEVVDGEALSQVLRELFTTKGLSKRVRVGVANQRTVMRTLELPPVTDRKDLAAAVSFQAQDQVPMPLSNAVLDFHPLGIIDTPGGPRQHVVLVAAQLDMVEHLLTAIRGAGLQPVGIDLSAFALIRSLYLPQPDSDEAQRVVYVNIDGLTNLAIAEGSVCRFTRVVGGGMEGMAAELAERLSISLADARAMLLAVDLTTPAAADAAAEQVAREEIAVQDLASVSPRPAEAVDEDVAPAEVSPHDVAPSQIASEQAPPAAVVQDGPTTGEGAPDETTPDATTTYRGVPADEATTGGGAPDETAPDATTNYRGVPADGATTGGGAPDETAPDATTTYRGLPADGATTGAAPDETVHDETTTYRGVPADEATTGGGAPDATVPDAPTTVPGAPDEVDHEKAMTDRGMPDGEATDDPSRVLSREDHDAREDAMSFTQMSSVPAPATPTPAIPQEPSSPASTDSEAQMVLENGIREIAGEVRNSLDFHRSQEGGGEVSHVVLSGSVLDVPGFAEALQGHLGLEVRAATVRLADQSADPSSMHRLAVAAGLATEDLRR